jgi:hypothetical protein
MGFEILKSLLLRFVSAIPNIIGAIVIAIIGIIIARLVSKVATTLLKKTGIDKLSEKISDIDIVQQSNIRISPSIVIGQLFYYVLLLIFLIAATEMLGMPALSQLISDIVNYVPNVISAMIVLIVGILIANILKKIVTATSKSIGILAYNTIGNFVFYFVFITAVISALTQAKIDTDFVKNNLSIILGGGVAAFALGYGLASKDMMSNFLASFYSRRHFNIGDTIKINDTVGKILYVDNTCVKMQAADRLIIIPLSKFMKEEVQILPSDFRQIPENE